MGRALARALDVRTLAARWLACERFRDSELFMAVTGEAHSAVEGLWHGVDPDHPLHAHPSGHARGSSDARRAPSARSHGRGARGNSVRGDGRGLRCGRNGAEPFRHSIHGALARAPPPPRLRHSRPVLPTAWTSVPSAMPMLDEEETGIGRATPGCLTVAWQAGRGVRRLRLRRAGFAPSGAGAAQGSSCRSLRLAMARSAAGPLGRSVAAHESTHRP